MRKILLIILLALSIMLAYIVIVPGFSLGNFTINNYKSIKEQSRSLNNDIMELESKNGTEYESKNAALLTAVNNYNDKKSQYESLNLESTTTETDVVPVDLYDIDFLWTIIGNYATDEDLILKFDVVKSQTARATSSDYIICNLEFTVSGDYISLTDFIYDLEDDDRLGFEINNFEMEKGDNGLQATFVTKEVPLNNNNLSSLTSSDSVINNVTSNNNSKSNQKKSTSNSSTMNFEYDDEFLNDNV